MRRSGVIVIALVLGMSLGACSTKSQHINQVAKVKVGNSEPAPLNSSLELLREEVQQRGTQENVLNTITNLASLNANSQDYNIRTAPGTPDANGMTPSQIIKYDPTFSITDGTSVPLTMGVYSVFVEQSRTGSPATSWAFVLSKAGDGTWWCAVNYESTASVFGMSAAGQTPKIPSQTLTTSPLIPGMISNGFPNSPASGSSTNDC